MIYNKILKFIVCFTLAVFIFNISLVNAEETSVTADPTPAVTESAPAPAPETTAEAAPTAEPTIENPAEPAPNQETVTSSETLPDNQTENITPLISTSSEPIIFDFSPSASSGQAPSNNSGQTETVNNDPANNVVNPSEANDSDGINLHEVITGIIRGATINKPAIIAQWQMLNTKDNGLYAGQDDNSDAGAQFLPSGQYEVDKTLAVCAIVAGVSSLNGGYDVSATINYPKAIAVNSACGQEKSQLALNPLDNDQANELICNKIKNNNNNLIFFGSDDLGITFAYDQLCSLGGLIETGEAVVYCADTALAYNDPAGDYQLKAEIKNNGGSIGVLENSFKYLELTTIENDFSSIQYGLVKLNEVKILAGDADYGGDKPTVRNTGNTRLRIKVKQNDFGLGQDAGIWNISYQAKVGTSTDFISYEPEQVTSLNDILELGQSVNMDFAVLIKKFPEETKTPAFWGKMTLSADKVEPPACNNLDNIIK